MKYFDVFNGDADGICALQQMRLKHPVESELITGIKRDIQLVKNVHAAKGDHVLVLDISLAKNKEEVIKLVNNGCSVQYFDHHLSGEPFSHPLLSNFINHSPETCTSLLVNEYLGGEYSLWAIVGAYGDNMLSAATSLADKMGLNDQQKIALKELGKYINYNGYGTSLDDLHFNPKELYLLIKPYKNPFGFIEKETAFNNLKAAYEEDFLKANFLSPSQATNKVAVYELPNEKWARRVSGVFGNQLSNDFPHRAHALLTNIGEDCYQVSVRSPQTNKTGAGTLCGQFETGGGREGAAGINCLQKQDKQHFLTLFEEQYQ